MSILSLEFARDQTIESRKGKNVESLPKLSVRQSRNNGLSGYDMDTWITEILEQRALIGRHLFLATLLLLAILLISSVVSLTVLIRLSPDYFAATRAQSYRKSDYGILSWTGIILKNLLGATLVILGVFLSLPGIPGQGLLTVLAGILLLDFPGKRGLLFRILSRPSLLRSINRLRAKFSRPPLVVG
jgi:hypothetical protein